MQQLSAAKHQAFDYVQAKSIKLLYP